MITAAEARKISEENSKNDLMKLIDISIRQNAERGQRYVNLILNEEPNTRELIRVHAWLSAYGFKSRSRALEKDFQIEIWW